LDDGGRSQLKPHHSSLAHAAEFRPTRWSVVLLSAQSHAPGSQAALAALCKLYWYPLYAFVRRRGYNPEDAQDLTQGFFLHLLDHNALTQVDPLKGKFRSFLLASIQNYLSKQVDRARCLKRGGKTEFVPLDAKSAEDRYILEPADYLTAEKIFDARCALTLLDEAMGLLCAECAGQGKMATLETLKPFLRPIGQRSTAVVRTSGRSARGRGRRRPNPCSSPAKKVHDSFTRAGGSHRFRPERDR